MAAEQQYSYATAQQAPVRQQASAHSLMDLFAGPFSHPAFAPMFASDALSGPNNANTFCYTATTYAEQAPDGTQYTQSSSSSYGPAGVRKQKTCANEICQCMPASCGRHVLQHWLQSLFALVFHVNLAGC